MQTELRSAKPYERYLNAIMYFSDKSINTMRAETIRRFKNRSKDMYYDKYINWKRQDNEIAVFTVYAPFDVALNERFDCIFDNRDPETYVIELFTLSQVIHEGWYPIDSVEHGFKNICVLTLDGKVPDIFKRLFYDTGSGEQWKSGNELGLCKQEDRQAIIDRRKREAALEALYGDEWPDYDK